MNPVQPTACSKRECNKSSRRHSSQARRQTKQTVRWGDCIHHAAHGGRGSHNFSVPSNSLFMTVQRHKQAFISIAKPTPQQSSPGSYPPSQDNLKKDILRNKSSVQDLGGEPELCHDDNDDLSSFHPNTAENITLCVTRKIQRTNITTSLRPQS